MFRQEPQRADTLQSSQWAVSTQVEHVRAVPHMLHSPAYQLTGCATVESARFCVLPINCHQHPSACTQN